MVNLAATNSKISVSIIHTDFMAYQPLLVI